MKKQNLLVPILVSIIPLGLVILNVTDLLAVFSGKGNYPFGSDFFGSYSIYGSKTTYVFYNIIFSLTLISTILLFFKGKRKAFFWLLFVNLILFFYPLLTNS